MEPDGAAHVFTLTDAETVSTNLRNPIVVIYYLRMWIEYAMTYTECDSDYLFRQVKYLCLFYLKKVILIILLCFDLINTDCFLRKNVLSVWPYIALLFAKEGVKASNNKCTDRRSRKITSLIWVGIKSLRILMVKWLREGSIK